MATVSRIPREQHRLFVATQSLERIRETGKSFDMRGLNLQDPPVLRGRGVRPTCPVVFSGLIKRVCQRFTTSYLTVHQGEGRPGPDPNAPPSEPKIVSFRVWFNSR